MSAYYLIVPVSDPQVTGVDDFGVQVHINETNFSDKSKYSRLIHELGSSHFWENNISIEKLDLEVEAVELVPGAKVTDFMRFSPGLIRTNFIVSEMVKKIISSQADHLVYFFDTVLLGNSTRYRYALMYVECLDFLDVDLNHTNFVSGDMVLGYAKHQITSREDFMSFSNTPDATVTNLELKPDLVIRPDILTFMGKLYVSEKLAQALLENNVSGIKIFEESRDKRVLVENKV